MKFRGKEIGKITIVLAIVALFCVGFASAALVNYVSNSMTATAIVTSAEVAVDIATGFSADPSTISAANWLSGSIALSGITAGGKSDVVNIRINNPGPVIPNAIFNMALTYTDTGIPAVGDPNNCDGTGAWDGNLGTCLVCSGQLCVSGQEFEVVGVRTFGSTPYPDPAITDQAACEAWTVLGGKVTGYWYDDGMNQICFANFKGFLTDLGFLPANPLNLLPPSPLDIPSGATYYQVVLKTTLDSTNKVQIAPGTYSLTANVQ